MSPERRAWYDSMIADKVREDAFQRALRMYAPGRTVVDIGAGFGHLSEWALDAGANRVILIEQDEEALGIARSRLEELFPARAARKRDIHYVHGVSQAINLPLDFRSAVDLVLTETLDSSGVGEGTLDIMADARRRFLKPGGLMIPSRVDLHVAPISNIGPILTSTALGSAEIDPTVPWYDWAPNEWRPIQISATGFLDALGLAFTAHLAPGVSLTNLPGHPQTHWAQGVVSLSQDLPVRKGQTLMVRGRVTKTGSDKCDVAFDLQWAK